MSNLTSTNVPVEIIYSLQDVRARTGTPAARLLAQAWIEFVTNHPEFGVSAPHVPRPRPVGRPRKGSIEAYWDDWGSRS